MTWKVIATFIDAGTAHKIRLVTDFDHDFMRENFTDATIKAFQEGGRSAVFEQPVSIHIHHTATAIHTASTIAEVVSQLLQQLHCALFSSSQLVA
jgi:hypothetical protein